MLIYAIRIIRWELHESKILPRLVTIKYMRIFFFLQVLHSLLLIWKSSKHINRLPDGQSR